MRIYLSSCWLQAFSSGDQHTTMLQSNGMVRSHCLYLYRLYTPQQQRLTTCHYIQLLAQLFRASTAIVLVLGAMALTTHQGTEAFSGQLSVKLEQWGNCKSAGTVQKHSFVLPFAKECWYCAIIPWKMPNSGYCTVAYTVSKAEFESYYYQATSVISNCYIAIGIQQWGYWRGNFQTSTTITFPVAFRSACYTIAITSNYNSTGSSYCDYIDRVLSYNSQSFQALVNPNAFFLDCYRSIALASPLTYCHPPKASVAVTTIVRASLKRLVGHV